MTYRNHYFFETQLFCTVLSQTEFEGPTIQSHKLCKIIPRLISDASESKITGLAALLIGENSHRRLGMLHAAQLYGSALHLD